MVLKNQMTGKGIGGGGGQTPGLGKGKFDQEGGFGRRSPQKDNEDWGADCPVFPIEIL